MPGTGRFLYAPLAQAQEIVFAQQAPDPGFADFPAASLQLFGQSSIAVERVFERCLV